jgi:hypothetical protein
MGWRVDWNLKSKRDGCTAALAIARHDASLMSEKCTELVGWTTVSFAGHPLGDKMASDTALSAEVLLQACSKLAEASEAARGINVSVYVPDDPDEV